MGKIDLPLRDRSIISAMAVLAIRPLVIPNLSLGLLWIFGELQLQASAEHNGTIYFDTPSHGSFMLCLLLRRLKTG